MKHYDASRDQTGGETEKIISYSRHLPGQHLEIGVGIGGQAIGLLLGFPPSAVLRSEVTPVTRLQSFAATRSPTVSDHTPNRKTTFSTSTEQTSRHCCLQRNRAGESPGRLRQSNAAFLRQLYMIVGQASPLWPLLTE